MLQVIEKSHNSAVWNAAYDKQGSKKNKTVSYNNKYHIIVISQIKSVYKNHKERKTETSS
jgi:hypothetical protein